jgi:hypothetical protein
MKKYILAFIILLCLFCIAEAKTLYVDAATGNDATTYADNAVGAKWATLGRALWGSTNRAAPVSAQAATAGDTVLVSAGTYTEPDTGDQYLIAFQPVNTGTSEGARIIIQAVGTVNLTTSGTAGGGVMGSIGKHYITWDGFSIDESTYPMLAQGELAPIMVAGASYVTIKNCTVIGTNQLGADMNHAAIFFHTTEYGYVYNNDLSGTTATQSSENCSAIYTYASNHMIIEHNNIHAAQGGIFIKGYNNDDIKIRFNKIYNLTSRAAIRFASSSGSNTNIWAYQNVIYHSAGSMGVGISTYTNIGEGCKIVNNTIYDVFSGLYYMGETSQALWYNNIVHTASDSAVGTKSYTTYPTVHAYEHNVYYNVAYQWRLDGGGTTGDWTDWTTTWAHDGVSPDGISGTDPLFADVTNHDFRLCTALNTPVAGCSGASPAIALGVDILDLDGDASTTDNIPAGAYVLGTETIGIQGADVTAPTVTAFTIPATASSLTVSISTFTATDAGGGLEYCINESASAPTASTCSGSGWSRTAQTAYTFANATGTKTLYAWAKDAAGNISTSVSDTVDITLPVSGLSIITIGAGGTGQLTKGAGTGSGTLQK